MGLFNFYQISAFQYNQPICFTGVLEWCVNTEPISEFLIGPDKKSGAHKSYNPNDFTDNKCMSLMKQTYEKAMKLNDVESKKLRRETFQEICRKFRPVFRHFFYENFPSPSQHLERRLAYTRSCATSSMIGYILGK